MQVRAVTETELGLGAMGDSPCLVQSIVMQWPVTSEAGRREGQLAAWWVVVPRREQTCASWRRKLGFVEGQLAGVFDLSLLAQGCCSES